MRWLSLRYRATFQGLNSRSKRGKHFVQSGVTLVIMHVSIQLYHQTRYQA